MSVPAWLGDLAQQSPKLAVSGLGIFLVLKIVDRLVMSPLSIATIFSVVGGKERRKDAKEVVKMLCDRPPPEIEPEAPPGSRRKRRR